MKKCYFDYYEDSKVTNVNLPVRATINSAGYDIFAPYQFTIGDHENLLIPTGVKAIMPDGYFGLIKSRSSLFKHGLVADGVIDSDYPGEIYISLRNLNSQHVTFEKGDRIAQLIILKYEKTDDDKEDERYSGSRSGGFGSTGS